MAPLDLRLFFWIFSELYRVKKIRMVLYSWVELSWSSTLLVCSFIPGGGVVIVWVTICRPLILWESAPLWTMIQEVMGSASCGGKAQSLWDVWEDHVAMSWWITHLWLRPPRTSSCTPPRCRSGWRCRCSLRTKTARRRWPPCRSTSGCCSSGTCPALGPRSSAGPEGGSLCRGRGEKCWIMRLFCVACNMFVVSAFWGFFLSQNKLNH